MMREPDAEFYGYQLMRATGCRSGTIYGNLAKLMEKGWLESRWEDVRPTDAKRPARRLYKLTPTGVKLAKTTLEEFRLSLGEDFLREDLRWA
jgi:PadR family transcriptional regulator PadR